MKARRRRKSTRRGPETFDRFVGATEPGDRERAEGLLDELVTNIARQLAREDYQAEKQKNKKETQTMRVAIYARYSSEHQNERSIDDQIRLCREHAERQLIGAETIGVYADYALSGSSLKNRPEAARLLTDAGAGIYDAVLTEALDRLSRDQEDIAGIFNLNPAVGAE